MFGINELWTIYNFRYHSKYPCQALILFILLVEVLHKVLELVLLQLWGLVLRGHHSYFGCCIWAVCDSSYIRE